MSSILMPPPKLAFSLWKWKWKHWPLPGKSINKNHQRIIWIRKSILFYSIHIALIPRNPWDLLTMWLATKLKIHKLLKISRMSAVSFCPFVLFSHVYFNVCLFAQWIWNRAVYKSKYNFCTTLYTFYDTLYMLRVQTRWFYGHVVKFERCHINGIENGREWESNGI